MTTTTTTSTAPGGVIGLYDAVGNACRYLDTVGIPGRRSTMPRELIGIEQSIRLDGSLAPGAVERALMLIETARPGRTLEDSAGGEPWSATPWAATVTLGLYATRLYSAPRPDPQAEILSLTTLSHRLYWKYRNEGVGGRYEQIAGLFGAITAASATRRSRARTLTRLVPHLTRLSPNEVDYAQLAVDLRDLEDRTQSRRVAWEWGWELGIGPRDEADHSPLLHPH